MHLWHSRGVERQLSALYILSVAVGPKPTVGTKHVRDCILEASSDDGAVRRMRTSLRYPNPGYRSGGEKAAPLGENGGAGLLVGAAVLEVSLRWKVVVDRGMD